MKTPTTTSSIERIAKFSIIIVLLLLMVSMLTVSLNSPVAAQEVATETVTATLSPTATDEEVQPTSTDTPSAPTDTPSPTTVTQATPTDAPTTTEIIPIPTGMPTGSVKPFGLQAASQALGCSGNTCTFQISSSSDDAGTNPINCSYSTNDNEIYFGLCSNNNTLIVSGFRFTNVTIKQGTKIAQAYLEFTVDGPYDDQISMNLYGDATGNSSTFGYTYNSQPAGRIPTKDSVTWNIPSTDHWELGYTQDTPDLTQVVQDIVNRPDWSSGNALSIIAKSISASGSKNHRRVIGFDRPVWYPGTQYSAKLVIKLAVQEPVIFIPGAGGTELDNTVSGNDNLLWLNLDALINPSNSLSGDNFLDPLQLDNTGVNSLDRSVHITNVIRQACLLSIVYCRDVYNTFINYLTSGITTDFPDVPSYILGEIGDTSTDPYSDHDHIINYQSGQDFWLFPLDFRKDLTGQANRLDVLVNNILQKTGAAQVDLVAHSMGGLVVRQYIIDPNHAAKVHQLITLGTPYLGAPLALRMLRYGWDFGIEKTILGNTDIILNPLEAKKLVQNWPGVYELLPANDQYFEGSVGDPLLYTGYFDTTRDLNNDGQAEGYITSRAAMDALLEKSDPSWMMISPRSHTITKP